MLLSYYRNWNSHKRLTPISVIEAVTIMKQSVAANEKRIIPSRDHSFITFEKLSEILIFLTPWYAHKRVRIRRVKNISISEKFANIINETPCQCWFKNSCFENFKKTLENICAGIQYRKFPFYKNFAIYLNSLSVWNSTIWERLSVRTLVDSCFYNHWDRTLDFIF